MASLALGGLHALAVRGGGRVAAWGANQHGALGLPADAPPRPGEPTLLEDLLCDQVAAELSVSGCLFREREPLRAGAPALLKDGLCTACAGRALCRTVLPVNRSGSADTGGRPFCKGTGWALAEAAAVQATLASTLDAWPR